MGVSRQTSARYRELPSGAVRTIKGKGSAEPADGWLYLTPVGTKPRLVASNFRPLLAKDVSMNSSLRHAPWVPPLLTPLLLALSVWTGCGAEQGPECRAFVACVAKLDAVKLTQTNVSRFLPEGACWGSDKSAQVCESSCRRGVIQLLAQEPLLACPQGVTP